MSFEPPPPPPPPPTGPVVGNAGFELPNLGSGFFAYRYGNGGGGNPGTLTLADQGSAGWTFSSTAGIAANGSGFGVTGADGRKHTVNLPPGRRSFVPRLESLEDRTVLSTLTVLNNLDSGPGSLRAEIAAASSGDTIQFASSLQDQTITLTSGDLAITKNPNIEGLGAADGHQWQCGQPDL